MESRRLILNDDITHMDIICGSNKEAFNHAGNKLFRFLIAFNHSRFQVRSRKSKGIVISSVLEQFTNAGCRFVERIKSECPSACATNNEPCWEIVSEAEARTKISHAFRDKRNDPDISLLLARIHDTIVAPNRLQALSSDAL